MKTIKRDRFGRLIEGTISRIFENSSIDPDCAMGADNLALIAKIDAFLSGKYRWEKFQSGIKLTECLIESNDNAHLIIPYVIPETGVLVKVLGSQCFKYKTFRSVSIPVGCKIEPHSFCGFEGAIILDKGSCICADDGYNYSLEEYPESHMQRYPNYIALDYSGRVIKDYRRWE